MDDKEQKTKLIKLSASSVKTFDSCQKKYFYTYIEKLPRKQWDHLELGTFCHAVLEQFHEEWRNDKNLMLVDLMGKCFAEQQVNFPQLKQEYLEEAKDMLQDYLHMMEKDGMPNVLSVEQKFEFSVDKYFLRGFLDRLDISKDGLFHIVDYKTTKKEKYLDDFQLLVYGLALKHKYPDMEKFRGSYVLLRHGSRYMTTEFNLYDLQKCEEKIVEFGRRIETETEWPKRPSPLCNYCDFYNPCQTTNATNTIDWLK